MSVGNLIFRYGCFAVLATLVNLAVQRLVLMGSVSGFTFFLALCLGTVAGLVVKYILDKRWIFHDAGNSFTGNTRQFVFYTTTGIVTTFIFWGMEGMFWSIWQSHQMREFGAVIGLSIGYIVKFFLDRKFVFNVDRRSSL